MSKMEIIICLVVGIALGVIGPSLYQCLYMIVGFVLGCVLMAVREVD